MFWVLIGISLDALLIGNPAFPNITHERICMFIGPAAIAVCQSHKQYPGVKGYAYRLGGDEFSVLYKDGAADELLPIREFAEECFLSDGEFPAFSGVSIGFERLTDENDLHKTLRLSDEMIYKEKKNSSQTRE